MYTFIKAFALMALILTVASAFESEQQTASAQQIVAANPPFTLSKFDALQIGMSYDEASALLASPGVEVFRGTMPGIPGYTDASTTTVVKWTNPGVYAGNMKAEFQDDRLISKTQLGLL